MPLKRQHVSMRELNEIAGEHGSVYYGSSNNTARRAQQHARSGYGGTMYYANTQNMARAEDRLLNSGYQTHNIHGYSGAVEGPGEVYVIQGRKYNR